MTTILLAIVLCVLGYSLYKKWQQTSIKANFPPGPPRWPLIGSYLHLLWSDFYRPHLVYTKWKDLYNCPVISWGMGPYNVVVANDYVTCKQVLTNPHIQGRVPAYPAYVRTYGTGNGYFADEGARWQIMKRHTLRALRDLGFGRRSVSFESVMEDEVKQLIKTLNETNSQPVPIPEIFFHTMINLISELVYGVRYAETDRHILTNVGNTGINLLTGSDANGRLLAVWPWIRHLFPVWSGDKNLKSGTVYLQEYIQKFVNEHKKTTEGYTQDIMGFMIETKKKYPDWTDEEIITSIMDLTFPNAAASMVIGFTLGFLANNPKKLQKCQNEIDEIVGRERLPNLSDRTKLRMVEGSIRETLRMQPITPVGVPHRSTADTELAGYFVPKDSIVIANQHAMNLDPKTFPDPHVFQPERFSNGKDDTFSFGLGKRVCVGETFARQNMFVVVASILQNFHVEISTNLDTDRFRYGLAVVSNPDYSLKFIPRTYI